MVTKILIGMVFLLLVVPQMIHWCGYIWTRFSKGMSKQREFARMLARNLYKGKPPIQTLLDKKKDNENGNMGYA